MQKAVEVSMEDLKRVMGEKSDSELHPILHVNLHEYTQEAILAATGEFEKRNLAPPEMTVLEEVSEKKRSTQEAPLGWTLKIVAFVTSGLLYGIPAASFYFYFVRRGERQKSRDWAVWGWSGFAIFLLIRILLWAASE